MCIHYSILHQTTRCIHDHLSINSRNAVNLLEMINQHQQAGEKALHGQITKKMNALPLPIAKWQNDDNRANAIK